MKTDGDIGTEDELVDSDIEVMRENLISSMKKKIAALQMKPSKPGKPGTEKKKKKKKKTEKGNRDVTKGKSISFPLLWCSALMITYRH